MTRRGFSLVELLVAIVVGGLVLSLTFELTNRLQIVGRGRAERIGLQANLATIAGALIRELGPTGFDSLAGSDITLVSSNSVTYRAPRGMAVACRVAVDSITLAADRFPEYRSRLPIAGRDSFLLYLPPDSAAAPVGWRALALVGGPIGATCPTGERGLLYPTVLDSLTAARAGPGGRAVVRVFESANARAYLSATGWQFGVEGLSAAAVVQPAAGPLQGAGGLELLAVNRAGLPLGPGGIIGGFEMSVRGLSSRELAVGANRATTATDSLQLSLRLHNTP